MKPIGTAPFALAASLLSLASLAGCSKPEPVETIPTPSAEQKAQNQAVLQKMEELKRSNPNLPPAAIGTMAVKMVQQEKNRRP